MNSIAIEQKIEIEASPEEVFKNITGDVSSWWSHSFVENPKGITLEAKLGGLFFEQFDEDGSGAIYATVTQFNKNKKIVLNGLMGMGGAVFGNIVFELEKLGNRTSLNLSHNAFGDITEEQKEKIMEKGGKNF